MVKLIKPKIIYSEEVVGKGIDGDPRRILKNWHTIDGNIILSRDEYKDETYGAILMVEFLLKELDKKYE